jgi:mediator of RNA polymerase II transcription subunit 17
MTQAIDFNIKITLVQDVSLTVRGRTYLYPVAATHYHILLPPGSPLEGICPPYKDGYPDVKTMSDYIRTMTARVLTDHFMAKVSSLSGSEWIQSIRGTSIQNADQEGCALHFSIDEEAASLGGLQRRAILIVSGSSLVDGNLQNRQWTWRPDGGEVKPLLEVVKQVVDESLS